MKMLEQGLWRLLLVALTTTFIANDVHAQGPFGAIGAAEEAENENGDDDDDRGSGKFRLTLLHNNDGESQLLNAGAGLEDFGGADRFATVVRNLRFEAFVQGRRSRTRGGSVLVSSGDNFLAGPEFNASLERGVPFFDSIAISLIGYDAVTLGNHEFDFGPDVLFQFIIGTSRRVDFLSANLDFSLEPALQSLADQGRIAGSTIVRRRGRKIGIVGATTENLQSISSPRDVITNAVVPAVQAEIDKLTARGANIIILSSHLQGIAEERALIPQLSDVDIVIAGGGDELLANQGDLLVPGDVPVGTYPELGNANANGDEVPLVTTAGNYKYVGRLIAEFDAEGKLLLVDEESGPVRVAGGNNPDTVRPDPLVKRFVTDPVAEFVAGLAENVIATSEVPLNGVRNDVRSRETNEGNLIADAFRIEAGALVADFGVPVPDVAITNGGGIRNDTVIPAGDITELDTFDMLPFGNFLSVVPDIPAAQFKELMEHAITRLNPTTGAPEGSGTGRFAQVSGFTIVYDLAGTAQELDVNGNVVVAGTRVKELTLDDGTKIVEPDGNGVGQLLPGAPDVTIATLDFIASGGDNLISAAEYPVGGEGRITIELAP